MGSGQVRKRVHVSHWDMGYVYDIRRETSYSTSPASGLWGNSYLHYYPSNCEPHLIFYPNISIYSYTTLTLNFVIIQSNCIHSYRCVSREKKR